MKITPKLFFDLFAILLKFRTHQNVALNDDYRAEIAIICETQFVITTSMKAFLYHFGIVAPHWTLVLNLDQQEAWFEIEPPSQAIFDQDCVLIMLAKS